MAVAEATRAFPGAEVVLVPEAGHLVMLKQPAAVHARLVAFLDG